MRSRFLATICVGTIVGALSLGASAKADDISTTLGAATPNFADDTKVSSGAFTLATAGQVAPFNGFCGSDTSSNCSTSWTFNYTVPAGDTITGATLTLGILDIDSAAAGNQIASYTINGDDVTGLLNTLANAADGGLGSPNSFYQIFTIVIPSTDFADLSGGTATVALALQKPGLGVLGTTNFNGAGLDFSTLDITATPGSTNPPGVPEPGTLALLLAGVAAFGLKALLSRAS